MRTTKHFLLLNFVLLTLGPSLLGAADFSIREKGGLSYLEENGIPYFGWFLKTSREEIDFGGDWKFLADPSDQGEALNYFSESFNDADWQTTKVPSDWTKLPGLENYQGASWYRKSFKVPKEWRGKFNRLEMDGVQHQGKIWINGRLVGEHRGGFSQFSFDVTGFLKSGGNNQITILVDNRRGLYDVPPMLSPGDRLGWWESGGICRKVKLISSFPQTLVKVEVEAEPVEGDQGNLLVRGLIYNAGKESAGMVMDLGLDGFAGLPLLEQSLSPIVVKAGAIEAFAFSAKVSEIKSWSPDEPNLYQLKIKLSGPLGTEENELEIGFRKFEVRGSKLYLNGDPYYIRGLNRHEDDPETGFYQSEERMREDIALIKELGVNHIRPAHYPNDPRWLSVCDRRGITLTEEIPLYQASTGWTKAIDSITDPGKDTRGIKIQLGVSLNQIKNQELRKNAQLALAEMIERDRNHPSIIIWSIGNENLTIAFGGARQTYQELYDLSKKLDPARPVTFALLTSPGLSPALERTAQISDLISVNEYYGWYFGKISGAGKFFDRLHKKYPDKPMIISEFGADTVLGRRDPTAQEKYSEEYQVRLLMETWDQMLERDFISGGMPWALADFRCGKWGAKHQVPYMNLKGLLTYDRKKKLSYSRIQELYQQLAEQGK